jgi:hypothetical protein
MAAVLTNPSMAISNAASKYRVVLEAIPNNMINAMLLMYMVSSARIRSGLSGPLNSLHKFRINDKQTRMVAIKIAILSIRKSP